MKQSRSSKVVWFLIALILLCIGQVDHAIGADAQNADAADWRDDWSVREGYGLEIDTEGYHFPTAIAFVPQPGDQPDSPLYFVLELGGRLKVVTRDRSIHVFAADFMTSRSQDEKRGLVDEQYGAAGLCLDPEHGYVFVTYTELDADGILRNHLVRFSSAPRTFGLAAANPMMMDTPFENHATTPAHQIGNMVVYKGELYVSVGDGYMPGYARDVAAPLGKVLRMTLDGEPIPSNPYFQDDYESTVEDYVWALGFRNPFGIAESHDSLFVVDNGVDYDRFVRIEAGRDYHWDGSDWDIITYADVVFPFAIGGSQIAFVPRNSTSLSNLETDQFFISATCAPATESGKSWWIIGVVGLGWDFDRQEPAQSPRHLIQYRGETGQSIAGLALGPDGLYCTTLYPMSDGRMAVLRISASPEEQPKHLIRSAVSAHNLMRIHNCSGCHPMDSSQPDSVGPSLDPNELFDRISDRLFSETYLQRVGEVDAIDDEPFSSYRAIRQEIVSAEGEQRVVMWMQHHLVEPKFDNPLAKMPKLGLSESEAATITAYLLASSRGSVWSMDSWRNWAIAQVPQSRFDVAKLFTGVGFGLALTLLIMWKSLLFFVRRRRRRTAAA